MDTGDTCALKLSGGELIKSSVLDNLHSLNIDTEYVFLFFKYYYYFEYLIVDSYFFLHILN